MKNLVSLMFVVCAMNAATVLAAQNQPASPGAQQPATQVQEPAAGVQAPASDTRAGEPSEQRAPASQRPAQSSVTISGCIQNAPAAPGATPSPSAAKFMLANAKSASAASTAVGTSGTAATATRYRLQGDDKTLSPHLNHQVEITGTVQPSSASETGAANASPGSAAAGPTLKVDSVKMVSATCP